MGREVEVLSWRDWKEEGREEEGREHVERGRDRVGGLKGTRQESERGRGKGEVNREGKEKE